MSKASREKERIRNEKYGRPTSFGIALENELNFPKFDKSCKREINDFISLIKTKFPEPCRYEFLKYAEIFKLAGAKFFTLFIKIQNGKSIPCIAYFTDLEDDFPLGIHEYEK